MPAETVGTSTPSRSADILRAVLVARRYFLDDRTKIEIAKELGISRFKVARLLDLARAENIVRIQIGAPAGIDAELGQRLSDRFGLREAWVIDYHDLGEALLRTELGSLAAALVGELIEPGGTLGISWGRTMRATVDALPTLPTCSVVQIAGGLPDSLQDSAVELVRRLAERTSGPAFPLHAPLFVADPATADRLRAEPQIARTLAMLDTLTVVAMGLGPWSDTSPIASTITRPDHERLDRRGVVAEVCGLFVRQDGVIVDDELTSRAIGVTADQLRATPNVMAVAGGAVKGAALRAVLSARLASHVVTDRAAAEAALA